MAPAKPSIAPSRIPSAATPPHSPIGILGITPCERPDLGLARALLRAGAAAAVDLGRDQSSWAATLQEMPRLARGRRHGGPATQGEAAPGSGLLGIRIPEGLTLPPSPLSGVAGLDFVLASVTCHQALLAACPPETLPAWYAEVCTPEDAQAAIAQGAAAIIARGQEAAGLTGEDSIYVLLQRIAPLAREANLPLWALGGIGLHTVAAAVVGGAQGVVLDSALAAFAESSPPAELAARLRQLDGSETRRLSSGHQVWVRQQREVVGLDGLSPEAVRERLRPGHPEALLPLGQDFVLGPALVEQCGTIQGLVDGLRSRAQAQLHQAQRLNPWGENNAWAKAHGVAHPIAQGPMTRVSDTAEFAKAVADAGALPFLALSLMDKASCEALLAKTAALLGDQPWGVGVLGFAKPEVLDPQLELLERHRPSAVILAGGRPAQARPLVEKGLPSYLHVPSPGLLKLFLAEGARHFIFEGRECGGHVGPRYSFVLWEQALQVLAEVEDPSELHILFAGGIHDAVSAAMVAAVAAPLIAQGARVGFLMGTAYITTHEAVSTGAVVSEFQEQVLAGEQTALVETAPGHAIRCLPSGFVDHFQAQKQALKASGLDPEASWERLEQLTVGRLRIATKGRDRGPDGLIEVPLARQRQEGMYMIGQVAALVRAPQSMQALHQQVTESTAAVLRVAAGTAGTVAGASVGPRDGEGIAIIGMACLYPGSPDLEAFWSTILEGKDQVSEVPADRWSIEQYYRGAQAPADKSVSKWGGFLSASPFDPVAYGIPPASLAAIEPIQLLSLRVAQEALADAGYAQRWFDRERTSVIFGAEAGMDLGNQYVFRNLWQHYAGEIPPALADTLPKLTEDSFAGMLVNVISGRIANRLGLGGVNYAVTSACASSLNSVELAVKELRAGSSDLVLAGGADLHNTVNDYLMFSSVGALSPSGRCRSFDAKADGIALGEGIGVLVLKRLSDAQNDGDRIYGVIEGIAGSSDGRGLGLTAPRKEGQRRALDRAYRQAGVLPSSVGLVEAHGTGTVVGDHTELKTLTEVYVAGGAVPGQAVLGSVKSQIGHTKCAAGIAGLIKVTKALHHGVRPGLPLLDTPNPAYRPGQTPFRLTRQAEPWLSDAAESTPRAAVSAFGFGGANFHAVVAAYPAHRSAWGAAQFPAEPFFLRGQSAADAAQVAQQVLAFLDASTAPLRLRDLAATVAAIHPSAPVQHAFMASDLAELRRHLVAASQGSSLAGGHTRPEGLVSGKLAFLFPGQGSQQPGMLRDLFLYRPDLARLLSLDPQTAQLIYPPSAFDESSAQAQDQALTDTRAAQPALAMVEWAAWAWMQLLGIKPDMAAGHSFGELVALASAGAYSPEQLLTLAHDRAQAMTADLGEDPGQMVAVAAEAEALSAILIHHPQVVVANENSPSQTVIAGPSPAMAQATADLESQGFALRRINTACAFHSPLMAPAEAHFAQRLQGMAMGRLRHAVYANHSASTYAEDGQDIAHHLARHLVSPVRFVEQIRQMHADGARIFVELGPRTVLTNLTRKILKGQPHTCLAIDETPGLTGLLQTIAQLSVLLPGIQTQALFEGRADVLALESPRRLTPTTWMIDGGRAWPLQGTPPAHAAKVIHAPVVDLAAGQGRLGGTALEDAPDLSALSNEDRALASYLDNMQRLIEAQRDVMVQFLERGTDGAPARPAARSPRALRTHTEPVHAALTQTAAVQPSPAQHAPQQSLSAAVVAVFSQATGYPTEALDPSLHLEADLSIDSIKRLEIVGRLLQDLGQGLSKAARDQAQTQLSRCKTLAEVIAGLTALLPDLKATSATSSASTALMVSEGLSSSSGGAASNGFASDVAPAPAPTPTLSKAELMGVLLETFSEATGYPPEALDPELHLEADLSIDSIKRLEIVGRLLARVLPGLAKAEADAAQSRLARAKTLSEMASGLAEAMPQPSAHPSADPTAQPSPQPSPQPLPLGRYTLEPCPAESHHSQSIQGWRVLLVSDALQAPESAAEPGTEPTRNLRDELAQQLQAAGAQTIHLDWPTNGQTRAEPAQLPAGCDAVISLLAMQPNPDLNPQIALAHLSLMQSLLRLSPPKAVLVVSAEGLQAEGDWHTQLAAPGLAGFVRTLRHECPTCESRLVQVLPSTPLSQAASVIAQELSLVRPHPVVHLNAGEVLGLRLVAQSATLTSQQPGGPGERVPSTSPLSGLGPESVVLLTGGARGITAEAAIRLVRATGCRLELLGRSPLPQGEESDLTRGLQDPKALRQALLRAQPGLKLSEVEARLKALLAERELRATLGQLDKIGARWRYTALDVSDAEAFRHYLQDLIARHGRIDGVVHGAGVIEDKLLIDKSPEGFLRVYNTKVGPAKVLSEVLPPDFQFVAFFSSVSSAFGNRGQIDYATANQVLDGLAQAWQDHRRAQGLGGRVVSLQWGPWDDTGMVHESLKADYARRGVGLIPRDAGMDALLAELHQPEGPASVVWMSGDPQAIMQPQR